jgi:pilus assembly protein CpaE
MYPISAGTIIEDREILDAFTEAFHDLSVRLLFELAELPSDWCAFQDRLDRVRPDVVLLDITRVKEPLDQVVSRIRSTAARPAVFALHRSADPESILAALRAGASEFLYPPFHEPLKAALERLAQRREKTQKNQRRGGKTLGFLSVKGGCGATTIACQVAAELARQVNAKVLLADLDFQTGLIGFLAKTKSAYSVVDAVNNIRRLDHSYWQALISNGIPNVEVITAPTSPVAKEVAPGPIKQVVAFMKTEYDWSVLDLGRNLTPATLSVLDVVDETFLISTTEVPSLHQAKQMIAFLLDSGYPRANLHLVLNRVPKRMEVTREEIGEMLGLDVYAIIDDDYQALQEAYSNGRLLGGGPQLARCVQALTSKITGIQPQKKRKFSLFG